MDNADVCLQGDGAVLFASAMVGCHYLTEEMLAAMYFPVRLPLVDLSKIIPAGNRKRIK